MGLLNCVFTALEAIKDHFPKLLVSLDDAQLPLRNGIRHVRAWELGAVLEGIIGT